jgi:hypothetical protein
LRTRFIKDVRISFFRIAERKILNVKELLDSERPMLPQNLETQGVIGKIFQDKNLVEEFRPAPHVVEDMSRIGPVWLFCRF